MEALLAALAIAALSCVGIIFWGNRPPKSHAVDLFLPLSIGAFLGVTFFELLPEAFEMTEWASIAIAGGFLGFFVLSRIISEYHHHHHVGADCDHGHTKARGSLVLLGDSVHNFADGVVIAVAFSINPALGIATTIGIALHEVPQEIAELYILRHAGYSRRKALLFNFLSALTVVLGVLFANLSIDVFSGSIGILIGIAAGNLLYIAASDLLPTLSDVRVNRATFIRQSALVAVGLIAIASLIGFTHGDHDEHGPEEAHSEESLHA